MLHGAKRKSYKAKSITGNTWHRLLDQPGGQGCCRPVDSTGKMPVGHTAKMAVLRPATMPRSECYRQRQIVGREKLVPPAVFGRTSAVPISVVVLQLARNHSLR